MIICYIIIQSFADSVNTNISYKLTAISIEELGYFLALTLVSLIVWRQAVE